MAKYKKKQQPQISEETRQEAEALTRATQRPGQTKEQSKLIAQGIQKGIEEYKKRQKSKQRELNKQKRKLDTQQKQLLQQSADEVAGTEMLAETVVPRHSQYLPWILLALSWGFFLGFILLDLP